MPYAKHHRLEKNLAAVHRYQQTERYKRWVRNNRRASSVYRAAHAAEATRSRHRRKMRAVGYDV